MLMTMTMTMTMLLLLVLVLSWLRHCNPPCFCLVSGSFLSPYVMRFYLDAAVVGSHAPAA